jgi:hypothetical protein
VSIANRLDLPAAHAGLFLNPAQWHPLEHRHHQRLPRIMGRILILRVDLIWIMYETRLDLWKAIRFPANMRAEERSHWPPLQQAYRLACAGHAAQTQALGLRMPAVFDQHSVGLIIRAGLSVGVRP